MAEISINGEKYPLADRQVLTELLQQHQPDSTLFAVAVNGCFVPRHQYADTWLQGGDTVDIVVPVSGG